MSDCMFSMFPVLNSNNKRQNCELTFRQQQKKQPDGSSAHVSADDAAAKRISATALAGICSHAEKAWIMSVTTFQWRNNCACVKTRSYRLFHWVEIQIHKRFERTLIYYDTIAQSANFRALCPATKRHLVQRLKTVKNEIRSEITYLFWLSCCFPVQCLEECWHDNDV